MKILRRIVRKYRSIMLQQNFNPGILGLFVNPFYFARRGLYKNISSLAQQISGEKILDVGCGTKPYRDLFKVEQYDGLEYETPESLLHKQAEFFYDGNTFPFVNECYDNIISNQVLEHVFNPDYFISEIHRVLKNGGHVLLTVPFVWDEHEQPYDFARYSSFGLKHLLEKNGFEIIEHRKSVNNLGVVFQLINDYIYKKLMRRRFFLTRSLAKILFAFFNITGFFMVAVTPKNDDLYLDNIVLAKKLPRK